MCYRRGESNFKRTLKILKMICLSPDLIDVKGITEQRARSPSPGAELDSFQERQWSSVLIVEDGSMEEGSSLKMGSWAPCKCRKAITFRENKNH